MVRVYVLTCYIVAFLSLLPWLLLALFSPGMPTNPVQAGQSNAGPMLASAIIWLFPVYIAFFGYRSWLFERQGNHVDAAGPATLIGIPAALLLIYFLLGRP